jgi:proteasome lid subunit RPN8/RPN11
MENAMPSNIRLPTYQYRLEYRLPSGPRLVDWPLRYADFAPAIDAAFLDGLRRGRFAEYRPPTSGVGLEPVFAHGKRAPIVSSFHVVLPTADGGEHRVEFGVQVFQSLARRVMVDLLLAAKVDPVLDVMFHVAAYLDEEDAPAVEGMSLLVEDEEPRVPIREGSRAALNETSPWDRPKAEDLPVLIRRSVLEDAVEEARRFPEREVGGFLLGHLRRDTTTSVLFLEVTCHMPAEATEATEASVTFTPASWEHARRVIAMRGEGEIFAGWVHSHPFLFCPECAAPFKAECVDKVLFYSPEDRFLMELTFAQPYMVGLQTGIEPRLEHALGHLPVRLYGWRKAEIVPRGFEVIEDR